MPTNNRRALSLQISWLLRMMRARDARRPLGLACSYALSLSSFGRLCRMPKGLQSVVFDDEEEGTSSSASFDYLLSMPLWNLTLEKVRQIQEDTAAQVRRSRSWCGDDKRRGPGEAPPAVTRLCAPFPFCRCPPPTGARGRPPRIYQTSLSSCSAHRSARSTACAPRRPPRCGRRT